MLLDMGAAPLLFVQATAFDRLRRSAARLNEPVDSAGFVTAKRATSLLLLAVLIGLAIGSVFAWANGLVVRLASGGDYTELDLYLFPVFFEVMIFADVLLLIVSIAFYDRYELLFRNAGFVISTVLLRACLTSPPPDNNALGLIALAYGLVVLGIFVVHGRQNQPQEHCRRRGHST